MLAFACLAFPLVAQALALPRPRDAIVGGEEAVPHSIPWQVSLRRKSDDFHFCGGSVLSANSIVTAAHCTEIWDSPGEVQIVAGGHNNAKPDGLEQRRDVAKLTVHEDYASLKNDIAIWELTEPLLLDERVQPVPMPTMMQESTGSCNVSGWGTLHSGGQTPDQLMVVSVPIVPEPRCQLEYPFQIAKSMICAGEYGKDSCQGDSGGPMVCYNADGSGYLGGIVSWGIGCGGLYHPGVYTEVSYFVDWVEAHTPAMPTDPPTTTMPPTTMPPTTMPPTTMPPTTMPPTTMPATTMPPTTMPASTMPPTTMPPTEPTTAMPGCPQGWVEWSDRCYYFSRDQKETTWTSAKLVCESIFARSKLASVSKQLEHDFILGAEGFTDTSFIGGTDVESEGEWTWLDGQPWDFARWGNNEPNGGEAENCLELVKWAEWGGNTAGWWNDIKCDNEAEPRSYICAFSL